MRRHLGLIAIILAVLLAVPVIPAQAMSIGTGAENAPASFDVQEEGEDPGNGAESGVEPGEEPGEGEEPAGPEEPPVMAAPVIVAKTPTSLKIRFDAMDGAEGYEIWKGTQGGTQTLRKTTTATTTVVTGLAPGTAYTITVRPFVRVDGVREPFAEASVNGKTAYLKRITPRTSVTYHSVKLTWDPQPEATGYKIMKKKGSTYKTIATVKGTAYTNDHLTTGKIYSYIVRPYVKVAGKVHNGPVGPAVSAKTCLSRATITAVTSGNRKLKVTWNKVAGATGYTLYRSDSKDGTYKAVKSVRGLAYTDSGLGFRKVYYYRVRAYRIVNGKRVYGPYNNTFCKKTKGSKELKILCVGNSFNQDTIAYVPPVLNQILPDYDFTYGACYTGSATLAQHVEWYGQDTPYTVFNYWDSASTKWKRYSGSSAKTLKEVLAMEDWDIITIQGNSIDTGSPEKVAAMVASAAQLNSLMDGEAQEPYDLVWFEWMAPRADQAMYERIYQAALAAAAELPIRMTIPVGNAFQAAR